MIQDGSEPPTLHAEAEKAALFRLLGSAHTLAILREFAADPGPHRFNSLQERLGLSPTTLSDRLDALCEAGILHRESYDEVPPRVQYRPTDRGTALRPILEDVGDWIEARGE